MTQFIQLQLPINVGVTIEEDAPVFLVKQVIESLHHPFLNTNRVRRGRKSKLTNRQLLAILIYNYYEGIYSSQKITN